MREKSDIDRRTVLRGITAGAATTMGFSGAAAAQNRSQVDDDEVERAVGEYQDSTTVTNVLSEHEDLLQKATDVDGLDISETAVDNLNVGLASDTDGDVDARDFHVSFNARRVDGDVTPTIHYQMVSDGGVFNVVVLPERDDRYAVFDPEDGELREVEGPSAQNDCGGCPDNKECQCEYVCLSCSCGYPGCPTCSTCGSCSICQPQYGYRCSCNCTSCGTNCIFQCP